MFLCYFCYRDLNYLSWTSSVLFQFVVTDIRTSPLFVPLYYYHIMVGSTWNSSMRSYSSIVIFVFCFTMIESMMDFSCGFLCIYVNLCWISRSLFSSYLLPFSIIHSLLPLHTFQLQHLHHFCRSYYWDRSSEWSLVFPIFVFQRLVIQRNYVFGQR